MAHCIPEQRRMAEWRGDKDTHWPHPRPHDTLPFFSLFSQHPEQPPPIASSQVELVEDKSMGVSIQNMSVIFKGSLGAGG